RSVAVPATDWPVPSVLTVVALGQLTTPDGLVDELSLQRNDTVTGELFHPNGLADGDRAPTIVGAALSRRTVTEPEPEFPRRSVAVAVSEKTPLPVSVLVAGVGPDPTP